MNSEYHDVGDLEAYFKLYRGKVQQLKLFHWTLGICELRIFDTDFVEENYANSYLKIYNIKDGIRLIPLIINDNVSMVLSLIKDNLPETEFEYSAFTDEKFLTLDEIKNGSSLFTLEIKRKE